MEKAAKTQKFPPAKVSPVKVNVINRIKDTKKTFERYQSLSKEKKKQLDNKRCKNLPEDEKPKLFECRKKYHKMRKNALL